MICAAIVVAAGSGQRFGDAGKSFAGVLGQPMAWWSLMAAAESASVAEIVLVCGEHSLPAATSLVATIPSNKPITVVLGGARRQDSALAGIHATSDSTELVAIHDAARPLVTSAHFDAVIAAAKDHGAAIAAAPVSDTIKRVLDHRVTETVPRDDLVSVQTPQAFQKDPLLRAFAEAARRGVDVTDEAALIEQMGGAVWVVPSSASNMKVTYPGDLAIVEALLSREHR